MASEECTLVDVPFALQCVNNPGGWPRVVEFHLVQYMQDRFSFTNLAHQRAPCEQSALC